MTHYIPTIGLEIHSELKTKSKMFCGSLNDPNERHPNINICEICLAHPGTLPVINEEAVKFMLKIGFALNCDIPSHAKFDRKNYFYPDLPKGYQISQYDAPLCMGGYLDIAVESAVWADKNFQFSNSNFQSNPNDLNSKTKRIKLRRIHLEEDTGRLIHPEGADYSLVDFNRAGVPLMELVTEPDIASAKEAVTFAKELQRILRYLEVSDADMEKGQMRVEVNISLQLKSEIRNPKSETNPNDQNSNVQTLGTKVEIKNLNSFQAVEGAVVYEIERQEELLAGGGKVIQETRGWDDGKKKTFSQRVKEEAHDYRYFPEPDLPPLEIAPPHFDTAAIQLSVPELPHEKKSRFMKEFELTEKEAGILVEDRAFAELFENTAMELLEWAKEKGIQHIDQKRLIVLAANYAISDLHRLMNETGMSVREFLMTPENFAELMRHIYEGKISSRVAKDVLSEIFKTGGDPSQILHERGLFQVSDASELEGIVQKIIDANPKPVGDYKQGKQNALQFLVGRVMGETKGKSNPAVVQELLVKFLGR